MFWKLGDLMSKSEDELKHSVSPLRDMMTSISDILKSLSEAHFQFEQDIQTILGPEKPIHNFITKDYQNLQKEKEQWKKKMKEKQDASSKHEKDKKKLNSLAGDYPHREIHEAKEER